MNPLRIIAACVLLTAVTVVVVQKSAISRLRQENRNLRAQKEEGLRLADQNEQIPDLRAGSEAIDSLRAANLELPKLRNEVRQLREQKPEIERLRLENQRLASAVKSASQKPPGCRNWRVTLPARHGRTPGSAVRKRPRRPGFGQSVAVI